MEATFKNAAGALANPTTVTLRIQKPDGTIASYTNASGLTSDTTGIWYRDHDIDVAGTWQFRFEGTGTIKATHESAFRIRPRRVLTA
jgi:hypothetical protein